MKIQSNKIKKVTIIWKATFFLKYKFIRKDSILYYMYVELRLLVCLKVNL